MDKSKRIGYPHWAARRRIIHATLIFCAAVVTYCLYQNTGTRTEETGLQFAFTLAGAVIGSYIFGATWEDIKNGVFNSGAASTFNDSGSGVVLSPKRTDMEN